MLADSLLSLFLSCMGMINPLFKSLSPIIPSFAIFCNALVMGLNFFLSDPPKFQQIPRCCLDNLSRFARCHLTYVIGVRIYSKSAFISLMVGFLILEFNNAFAGRTAKMHAVDFLKPQPRILNNTILFIIGY